MEKGTIVSTSNYLLFAVVCGLLAILFSLSCKKELSCENCLPGLPNALNLPPVAKAGQDQSITLPKDSVTLDGSASSDPDGNISDYAWSRVSGPTSFTIINPSASITTIRNLIAGTYRLELKVTDKGGLTDKDTVNIVVDSLVFNNRPPIANAGADETITLPTNTVTLNGNASTDPDNNITTYNWTKVSGPLVLSMSNPNLAQTHVNGLILGVYLFELIVTDAGGLFSKDTVQITVNNAVTTTDCAPFNRPLVPTQVVPFGALSVARSGISVVSAGSKIFFAGGISSSGYSARVDIYDFSTQVWTTSEVSLARGSICAVAAGNKVFFAGGYIDSNSVYDASSRIDIYDLPSGAWTTAELSIKRFDLAAVTVGTKVFFAGGQNYSNGTNVSQTRVDIYDLATNTWSVSNMSEPRCGLTATAAGNKVYFSGGLNWHFTSTSTTIDIYDVTAGTWSVSSLSEGKAYHGSLFKNNKVYWFGGYTNYDIVNSIDATCRVEVRDVNNSATSFFNLSGPGAAAATLEKQNQLVFISYTNDESITVTFDIYNSITNTWSVGQFKCIPDASFISVNNTIYVAGGHSNNRQYFNGVWKLEF